jgi:hypothetical protein
MTDPKADFEIVRDVVARAALGTVKHHEVSLALAALERISWRLGIPPNPDPAIKKWIEGLNETRLTEEPATIRPRFVSVDTCALCKAYPGESLSWGLRGGAPQESLRLRVARRSRYPDS